MRLVLWFCFILSSFTICLAQTALRGVVTYQNTGEKVEAIQVTARGASPVISKATSNKKGVFVLNFPNKRPGEAVNLGISTWTYDLVNHSRELEVILPRDVKDRQVRLIVCKKGERDRNALEYYQISTEYINKSYEKKQKQLNGEIAQMKSVIAKATGDAKKLQEELATLRQEKDQLYLFYQSQSDKAQKLAEEFSRIDLDQVNAIYRQAFQLFRNGKIEEARHLLDGESRQSNLKQLRKMEEQIKEDEITIAKLEKRRDKNKKKVQEAKKAEMKNYLLAAQLAELEFDFEAVEQHLLSLVGEDTTQVENLWVLANFYAEINQQDQAIIYYNQALRHCKSIDQIAESRNALGRQLVTARKYDQAKSTFLQAIEIIEDQNDSVRANLKPVLAMNLNNLGTLYRTQKSYNQADSCYQRALNIYERLAPDSSSQYSFDIAMVQNNLGILYTDKGQYNKAEPAFLKALRIKQNLAQTDPNQYKPNLADTWNNLGVYYNKLLASGIVISRQKRVFLGRAEDAFVKAAKIYREIANSNPQRYNPDLAMVYMNLGVLYQTISSYDKAESAYLDAHKLYEQLAKENEDRYVSDLAKIQLNLGSLYLATNKGEMALAYLDKSLPIYRILVKEAANMYSSNLVRALMVKSLVLIKKGEQTNANKFLLEAKSHAEQYPNLPLPKQFLENFNVFYKEQ